MKPKQRTILVVDDRINTLKVLMAILADEGYRVLQAPGGDAALAQLTAHPETDLVLADLMMPGMDGLELFRRMRAEGRMTPLVIMTAYATVTTAVEALKEGVTDYLIKPLNYDELSIILDKACRAAQMSAELADLRRRVGQEESFHGIVAASRAMHEVLEVVRTVGPTEASVLIRGETGTGKELIAQALHAESPRKDQLMVCINCAALTESLLEAELFGYVKGAFTGASSDRKGRLEEAHGGTLFLDELGHMSLGLQTKLLRFLQEQTFEPVGSPKPRKVNVRLIAATNTDISAQIEAGEFLNDLLYRIEVISIVAPPLRERPEDIPLLVNHFLARFANRHRKKVESVNQAAMEALCEHPWLGNVRELKNCLERAVIMCKGAVIGPDDLPRKMIAQMEEAAARPAGNPFAGLPGESMSLRDMEKLLIKETLSRAEGNKSLAAKMLGISRKGLYEKMERYGIGDS